LKNHYRDLYQDLEDIEAWVRTEYPNFLLTICKLLEIISRDPEFKELKAELERMNVGEGGPSNVLGSEGAI
jgi:ribosome biogenesis SPOUT family RNA methylase Rps3